jgi:Ca2+-binding RTX toxin-like protein
MIANGVVSIPSSVGSATVFTVTGTRTLAMAQGFQAYLDRALAAGTLTIVQGDTTGSTVTFAAPVQGHLNEAVMTGVDGASGGISATVPGGYQFLFDNVSGATTITGSGMGSDVLVAAINAAASYFDEGGNNTIVFVDGDNTYHGDTTASAGNDYIAAGSGYDTIFSGAGHDTINSGTGSGTIVLQDTGTGGVPFNDYVYLDDGHNEVYADGMHDAVLATGAGQTIAGGADAAAQDGVVLVGGNGDGNDVIDGGAATMTVFDQSGGNSVFGGAGLFNFIGGSDVSASVVAGTGTMYLFVTSGDSITFAASDTAETAYFIAGTGNETLNGAFAQNNLLMFGGDSGQSSITAGITDLMVGGSGNDTLVSGAGHETLTGGAGNNVFLIDATTDGVGATILISDFGASAGNVLEFANYTTAEINAALNSAQTVSGGAGEINTILTLSDNTQVTLVGVSSLNGHTKF